MPPNLDEKPVPDKASPHVVANAPEDMADHLLTLLRGFLLEIRSREHTVPYLALDSHLERDLALDSLSRTELLRRIEQLFGVQLGERALAMETPGELLSAILEASGASTTTQSVDPVIPASLTPTAGIPHHAKTLIEMLDWHARTQPEKTAIQLYGNNSLLDTRFSYAQLWQGAQTVAAGLQMRGLQPHQAVAIMLPTGADYFVSFFGILLAGGIPIPIYPPMRPSQIEEHLYRHARLLDNAQAVVLITFPEAKLVARLLKTQVATLRNVTTVADITQTPADWKPVAIEGDDLAFLQYTSGSTGDPKGVMLSHTNLLTNIRAMGKAVAINADDVFVSWLPLYHDMGLIGACLGSLYHGLLLVVMSPLSFLARPVSWLQAIHRHRGTLSAAPNFAYELCVRTIQDQDIEGLDLSTWRMSCNGAEPVSPTTIERFTTRFGRYGFRAATMAPVYGLAECSVGLALSPPGRAPVIDRIRRDVFIHSGKAEPADPDDTQALTFPACGQPLDGHQIRIVDDHGRELPERREGRLEFKGLSATKGYFRNPEATARLFPHGDDWLDSGDRAYIAAGDIYLTGRVKDLIIRGGRNIYPYELEQAIGELPGIRKGCVAAFASRDPANGSERLIVVAETRISHKKASSALRQQIQQTSVNLLGIPPDDVALVAPYTILKTSSGKIRRTAVRELYEHDTLGREGRAVWLQLARIAVMTSQLQLRRWWQQGTTYLYAGYAWMVYGLLAPPTWLGIMLLPTLRWRWWLSHRAARLLARLTGTSITVHGLEHLPKNTCVLIANHSSFLDAYVLIAAIPRHFHYVAKRELLDNRWLAKPLKRIATLFVERSDTLRSVDEAHQLIQYTQSGKSLAFFPEGTFTRTPGLLPFRMGAFVTASQTGVPLLPVTIRGTRSILCPNSWFPRRGRLAVIIAPQLLPDGHDWAAAVRLRAAARAIILHHCGEPDLES